MKLGMVGVLVLAFALCACSPQPADNVEIVEGMINAINQRNFDALNKYVSPIIIRHSGATPGVTVTSLEQFVDYLNHDVASVPDSVQTIEIIFNAGDKVALRATYAGTQTGPMGPFPPSGKHLEIPFNAILRVENGKIAEMWVEWDNLNALTQLGHFPTSTGTAPEGE